MKVWEDPKLFKLAMSKTSDGEHYCHGEEGFHSIASCTHNHGGGSCKDPDHIWNEAHKASCCCIGVTQTPQLPES